MEKKIFNLLNSPDFNSVRIDKFLQLKLKNFSRTKIQKLINEEFVKINKKPVIIGQKQV